MKYCNLECHNIHKQKILGENSYTNLTNTRVQWTNLSEGTMNEPVWGNFA